MGKFRSSTEARIYGWTLDGMDESSGDVESPVGWFGKASATSGDNESEFVQAVMGGAWFIVRDDSQGFTEVEVYATEAERDEAYGLLEDAYAEWAGDFDDDDE